MKHCERTWPRDATRAERRHARREPAARRNTLRYCALQIVTPRHPERRDKPLLDGVAIAVRQHARGVAACDPRLDQDRPASGMEEFADGAGLGYVGDRPRLLEFAGAGNGDEVDAVSGVARL